MNTMLKQPRPADRVCACGGRLTYDETAVRTVPHMRTDAAGFTRRNWPILWQRSKTAGAYTCNRCEHCE